MVILMAFMSMYFVRNQEPFPKIGKFKSSADSSSKKEFFTEKGGMLMVSTAHCQLFTFELGPAGVPEFHRDFVWSLKELEKMIDSSEEEKDRAFADFINEYGTHYLTKGDFGAKV